MLTQFWRSGKLLEERRLKPMIDGKRSCLTGGGEARFVDCGVDIRLPKYFWMEWGNPCPDCAPDSLVNSIGEGRHFNNWAGVRFGLGDTGVATIVQHNDRGDVEGWCLAFWGDGSPPTAELTVRGKRERYLSWEPLSE